MSSNAFLRLNFRFVHRLSTTNPAEVFRRISPCHAPCCLRPRSEGSAFGFQYFRGPMGLLALGPGDALAILITHRRSQGRSVSASALRSRFFASMLADSRLVFTLVSSTAE
jgi:hypothetical protein